MKRPVRLVIWFTMLMSCALMLALLSMLPPAAQEDRTLGRALLAGGAAAIPVSLLLAQLAAGPGMCVTAHG